MSTQAPTFTQPLQSVVALEGSAATFEAQVTGKNNHFLSNIFLKLIFNHFKINIYYKSNIGILALTACIDVKCVYDCSDLCGFAA